MQNVEHKAELRDLPLARAICARIGARHIVTVRQIDTYFRVARGRLKKREAVVLEHDGATPEPDEYIFYERPDKVGGKISKFTVYSESEARAHFGPVDPPIWLVVRKTRELYMLGTVRIHLDVVEDLGSFFEIESLVTRGNTLPKATEAADSVRASFAPVLGEPIADSYSDMLERELESDLGQDVGRAG
jgi:adenylate cyclase class IV